MKSAMKNTVPILAAVLLLTARAQADLITQWTFEGDVTTPSTGAGTASLVGVTATFAAGNPGRGWNTTSYAAQGAGSGTRGVQFMVSTAGYENITLSFDHRASGTASRWAEVQYTTNGGSSWTPFADNGGGLSPHDAFYTFDFDLSSVGGANDNPLFGLRIVSIFSPVAFDQNASLPDYAANTAYMRANAAASYTPGGGTTTGDYGSGGTWRFDNVTINGTAIAAVPEASSFLFAGLVGCVTAGAYWTRRRGG